MATDASVSTLPTYEPDLRYEQAKEAIANHLGVAPSEVTLSIGRKPDPDDIGRHRKHHKDQDHVEELIITVHKKGLALEEKRITDEVRSNLAELKPLADHAQMVPQEQLATQLFNDLKAATEGTNFNQKLLEWPGFRAEVISNGWEVGDYAAQNVEDGAYGVKITLHFPHAKGEDTSKTIERFKEVLEGRLPQIKEILTERALKYTEKNITERGLNEEEKQKTHEQAKEAGKTPEEAEAEALKAKIELIKTQVREDIAKLIITPTIDHNNLVITLRSPDQAKAYEKADPNTRDSTWQGPPEGADELRNTNPLTSRIVGLTTGETPATETTPARGAQLPKALMRALLFDKEKHVAPDALQIFGRRDMQAALIKEIMLRVLPQHPEKKEELEKIITSELFLNHGGWHNTPGDAGVAKLEPETKRIPGTDVLELAFTLRKDKDPEKNQVLQVVNGLAALAGGQQQQQDQKPQSAEELAKDIIACGCDKPGGDMIAGGAKTAEGWAKLAAEQKAAQTGKGWSQGVGNDAA